MTISLSTADLPTSTKSTKTTDDAQGGVTTTRRRTFGFTGGGSAGHVTPNFAVMERCKAQGIDVVYFGTPEGMERDLVARWDDGKTPYYAVPSERLRRYFDWRNFLAPFRVVAGIFKAARLVKQAGPDVLFSKGGFASFPVVLGAWLNRIPVVIHESDTTPGLANRMSLPFARKLCVGFEQTVALLGHDEKVVYTGTPIRGAFSQADPERARVELGLEADRPVILVVGGSLGSRKINETIRANLDALLERGQLVHICGKGNTDASLADRPGYHQHDYLTEIFPHLMALADVVVCRAGANTLLELVKLNKPSVLIPLPVASSRGDQRDNAENFARSGLAQVVPDEELSGERLLPALDAVLGDLPAYQDALTRYPTPDSVTLIFETLDKVAR